MRKAGDRRSLYTFGLLCDLLSTMRSLVVGALTWESKWGFIAYTFCYIWDYTFRPTMRSLGLTVTSEYKETSGGVHNK